MLLHIPTTATLMVGWYLFLVTSIGFLVAKMSRIRDYMFDNIPEPIWVIGIAVAVTVFLALVNSWGGYLANQKDEAVKKKEAKLNGTTYDPVNEKLSASYYFGYGILSSICAAIIAIVVVFAMDCIVIPHYPVSGVESAVLYATVGSVIVYFIVDTKWLTPCVSDPQFFRAKEKEAIDAFCSDGEVADPEEEVTPKSIDDMVEDLVREKLTSLIGKKR